MPIASAPTAKLAVIITNGSSLARTVASQYVAQISVLPSASATPIPSTPAKPSMRPCDSRITTPQ